MTQERRVVLNSCEINAQEPAATHVIGADIGGTNLRLGLADGEGMMLGKWSTSIMRTRDAESVVRLMRKGVDALLREASLPRDALGAIAAGAPGITNVDKGVVIATSYLMGWRDVPLRDLLEAEFKAPAAVDNDVNLAAIGERRAGVAQGEDDFVFLAIGTGIGAGIVMNGQIHRGSIWTAGEIGYMLVPDTSDDAVDHGEPGALESLIGGEGIKEQWQSLWSAEKTSLPKDLTATQIFDHAHAGDALAQSILQRTARILSRAIYNVTLVLNCPLFVLGGGVGVHPGLLKATQSMLDQLKMRSQPRLTLSDLGTDAQLMGALRLALDLAGSRSTSFANQAAVKK